MRKAVVPFIVSTLTAALVLTGGIFATIEPTQWSIVNATLGLAALAWAALGLAISRRASGRTVGLLMTLVAFNIAFTTAKEAGWSVLAARPDQQPHLAWVVAVLNESAWWLLATLSLLLLYFPDGRLPSSRWRFLPPLLLVAAAVNQAAGAMAEPFRPPLDHLERPFPGPPLWLDAAGFLAFLSLVFGSFAAALSVGARFSRADAKRRAQIKWLGLGGFGIPGFLVVCLIEVYGFGGPSWPSLTVGIATIVGVPAAVAIGMLRHDLYDVDRALSAVVTYAIATGTLVAVFLVTSAAMGVVLGRDSALTAAVATAVTLGALSPLRRALQRLVDRRLYPQREAAFATIRSLERRTHSGEARPEQLEGELRLALRDPGLHVAYHLPGGVGLVDSSGAALPAAGSPVPGMPMTPVTMDGAQIGALIPTTEFHSPGLLRSVALAAATLVEIVRLRIELRSAVRDLEASKSRLVQVGDEERRRLERDLHDGAQQRLVSLGMSIRLAQRHLGDRKLDREALGNLDALMDQTVAELGTAVAELRQIAHGLRPSRLDDGLPSALSALSRGFPVPIELDITQAHIPDHLATTIYFVASEALANAVKYAGASRIGVRVAQCGHGVEISVRDDGNGGAVLRNGSGLAGLRDRVDALGGSFSIDAAAGRGTVVHAVLPCAS